jgi:hypothetical protein
LNLRFLPGRDLPKGRKKEKVADLFDFGSVVIAIGAVVLGLTSNSGYISGTFRYSSIVAVVVGYLATSLALKRQNVGIQRVFLGFACVGCGSAIFNTIHRYSFISTLKYMPGNLLYLQSHAYNLGEQYSIPLALLSMVIPLVGYKRMRLNKWFWLSLSSTIVLFVSWILIGYPQDFGGVGQFFVTPFIPINSLATRAYGLGFETATNFTALLIPATLFFGKDHEAQGDQGTRLHGNLVREVGDAKAR